MRAWSLVLACCLLSVRAKRSSEISEDLNPFKDEVSRTYGNSWIAGSKNKQYQFHIGVQSWITAREYCLTQESDLVTISSPEELKWLLSHYSPEIKSTKDRLVQIGALLDDSHGLREWKWVNGDELDTQLTPWKSGEPFDHLNGRERCATLSVLSKKLDDIDCDAAGSPLNMFRFVCERTNVVHEMHEINNNPLWKKVEEVLQYFGFGQTMNGMVKSMITDEEDYWDDVKKENERATQAPNKATTDEGKSRSEEETEVTEAPEVRVVEEEQKKENASVETNSFSKEPTQEEPKTELKEEKSETESKKEEEAGGEKKEIGLSTTTPEIVEVTETPSSLVTVEDTVPPAEATAKMDDWTVNGTESAQQDENPIQQKTSADDEITANLLTVNSRKMSEELVAVEDPQTGPIMEVFETATPETNIVRTTRPEKTGTIDDRIQNIENMIHTVESLIGNNTDKTVNNISIVELLTTEATTIPAVRSEQKKEEHYEGHCDDDKTPEVPTAEKKIDDFLSTLRAFLARNKLKDLSKIANAKNSNKTLVERLKEAVQNNARELKVEDEGAGKKTENGPEEPKGEQGDESEKENEESKERKTEAKEKETEVKEPKIEESKQQANEEKKQKKEEAKEQNGGQVQMKKLHSNEIEKELSSVLGDSISENISSSSTEAQTHSTAKAVTIINEMKQPKKKSGRWEVQHNEPFQDEAKASDLNHNATVKIHSAPSISKEVQVDDPKTTLSAGSLFPALPKIDPKNPPVESEESEKRRQDLREKTDAIYKQFSERLDTSKLIERIRQNELARKRISTDRVESLAAPAPSTQHNVNAFFEMEKLFSDIGKNFKRFLATRI